MGTMMYPTTDAVVTTKSVVCDGRSGDGDGDSATATAAASVVEKIAAGIAADRRDDDDRLTAAGPSRTKTRCVAEDRKNNGDDGRLATVATREGRR